MSKSAVVEMFVALVVAAALAMVALAGYGGHGSSHATQTTVLENVPTSKTVLQVGDSLSAFSQWTAQQQFDGAGYKANFEAHPGTALGTVNDDGFTWLPRLRDLITKYNPESVVMEFGTNDAGRATDPAVFEAAMKEFFSFVGNRKVYWVNVVTCSSWPHIKEFGLKLNEIIARDSAVYNYRVIDMSTVMCIYPDMFMPDTVHYTVAGEQLYAKVILHSVMGEFPIQADTIAR